MFRALMCEKKTNFKSLVTTKTTYKNPEIMRNGNLLMKSLVLVAAPSTIPPINQTLYLPKSPL